MAKSKKIEKETRRLIESVSDVIKKKGDRYKFKTKNKKTIKKIKRSCVHWTYRKGKETPTLIKDPENPSNWKCTICGASFPIRPLENHVDPVSGKTVRPYEDTSKDLLALVNQIQFYSVKLGGDAEDTKMFLSLKKDLARFPKVARQVLKNVNKREKFERNRAEVNSMAQFDIYAGFNYNN